MVSAIGSAIHRTHVLGQRPPLALAAAPSLIADDADATDHAQLKEAIVCQLDSFAAKTALVTSGVNALLRPDISFSGSDLARHLPSQHSKLMSLMTVLAQDTGDLALLEAISHLFNDLEDCEEAIVLFAADEQIIGTTRAGVLHRDRLARAWQALAQQVALSLETTKRSLRWNLSRENWQNASVLTSLLRSTANGFTPCIDDHGDMSMPALPQQRRWPRFCVLQNCTVSISNQTVQALLRDASAGGLGLDRLPITLKIGAPISVTTETCRLLSGTVAWSKGARAGISFALPLTENDPLLLG
jgi:PilZ domain